MRPAGAATAYRTIFENDRVRVLEYTDKPGYRTTRHGHPDSVMYTLSSFRRRGRRELRTTWPHRQLVSCAGSSLKKSCE